MELNVAGQNVSRETYDDLVQFSDLVKKWTPKINLIAPSTIPEIWDRHIVDSAQLLQLAPKNFDCWVDIGSGGGFPGIIVAIYAKIEQPNATVTLIESDQRKATFLRTASRELGLNTKVIAERIEQVSAIGAGIVSARALATLSSLLPLAMICLLYTSDAADE